MNQQKFFGIRMANNVHDRQSKDNAQRFDKQWDYSHKTLPEWIECLSNGQTIAVGAFAPYEGKYRHRQTLWRGTQHIFADADNIKGVEFDDDGKDTNPTGVEAWTHQTGLSEQFPTLKEKARAVGQSVSSMADWREPQHRRYRLVFEFDKAIRTVTEYHHVLIMLAKEFPIIPQITRQPAQPVFGNSRPETRGWTILDNVLPLDEYLSYYNTAPPTEIQPPHQKNYQKKSGYENESIQDYMNRHRIAYKATNEVGKYYVACPYAHRHTGQKQGATDTYVFEDSKGWGFYCSHAHCKAEGRNNWHAFKVGMGLPIFVPHRENTQSTSKPKYRSRYRKGYR